MIDIHFHGTKRIDTKDITSSEQILEIANECAIKDITGFLLTLYPSEITSMRKTLSHIKKAMEIQKEGAKILGAYLEGPFLNPNKAGALESNNFLLPDEDVLKELIEDFEDTVKIITVAPELPGALKLIEKIVELGIIVSMGHSDATYNEAHEGFKAGASLITHLFNAMRGIHHREPGLAGFGVMNQKIYVELIADGRHLSDEIVKWIFSIKHPERIILVSDMIKDEDDRVLKGGSLYLSEIRERLKALGIENEKLFWATEINPKRLLNL